MWKYLILPIMLMLLPACSAQPPQAEKGTVLSLSATSTTEVENDRMLVNFRIEAEGGFTKPLQEEVNRTSRRVQALLAKHPEIKLQTLGRSLQPLNRYDKARGAQVRGGWQLVQREQATSDALEAVPKWVDEIEQAGAHLDGLRFTVSQQRMESTLEKLRMSAVKKFREQATAMTKTMDADSFRILKLRTDNRMPPVPVMQRGVMAMSDETIAPSFNAGESRLSVTVSGEILLPGKTFSVK